MNIRYAMFTAEGDREINEDSINVFCRGDDMCCVLCDGLGGHGMGDLASKTVVKVFGNLFDVCDANEDFLQQAFSTAQSILLAKQTELRAERKMKTTATAVLVSGGKAYIGHIGDSRVYVFNKNKVAFRTLDHSIPQMLVLSNEITESEIRNHPDRSMLLKVLGTENEKQMFELQKPISLRKCQAFLLCSDGFWELIEEEAMCSFLKSALSVDEWLEMMLKMIKENGQGKNMDNFSAIAIWCS